MADFTRAELEDKKNEGRNKMGAQTAQGKASNLSRSTTSQCVAYEAFDKGLKKIFGEYRLVFWDVRLTKDLKIKDPLETEEMCGGQMWKVPKGWPLEMLKAYRHFKFSAKIYCLESGNAWDVESEVGLDFYDHPKRKGWEAMYLIFFYSRTGCEKKEKKNYRVIREATPTGWWFLSSLQEKKHGDFD